MDNIGEAIWSLIVAILLVAVYMALGCWLWGVIMVSIFGLPQLTFTQFCGLYALCRILFGQPSSRVNNTNNRRKD